MKPSSEKKEVSSTGRITRVDVKYAFISSNKLGSIFVPPSAALPPACAIPDLTKHLKAGDIVHFVAVRQHGKNECQWLATKVTLSSRNSVYQIPENPSTSKQQIVMVSLVTETFAYGFNEELGMVFIPGAAFSSTEVSKLDSYIVYGDFLIVFVRPQAERSGCCWIAEFATKVSARFPALSDKDTFVDDLQIMPTSSEQLYKKGYGLVREVNKTMAFVYDPSGETFLCSSLAWKGGCRGNIYAEGLDEIVSPGENVYFEAVFTDYGWRAQSWNSADNQKQLHEAFTQTAITSEQMILRALDDDIIKYLKTKIPHILAFNNL